MSKRAFIQILVLLSAVSQFLDFLPISHLTIATAPTADTYFNPCFLRTEMDTLDTNT